MRIGIIGCSRRSLERRFKSRGETLHAHLQRRRIEIVKRLMVETNFPLTEITEASGFADYRYLATVFRDQSGTTMSAWRKARGQP
jgi:LacI family transcriptional regulator